MEIKPILTQTTRRHTQHLIILQVIIVLRKLFKQDQGEDNITLIAMEIRHI